MRVGRYSFCIHYNGSHAEIIIFITTSDVCHHRFPKVLTNYYNWATTVMSYEQKTNSTRKIIIKRFTSFYGRHTTRSVYNRKVLWLRGNLCWDKCKWKVFKTGVLCEYIIINKYKTFYYTLNKLPTYFMYIFIFIFILLKYTYRYARKCY